MIFSYLPQSFKKYRLRQNVIKLLHAINHLQKLIFSIYIERDYKTRHLYYEKMFHHFLKTIFKLKKDFYKIVSVEGTYNNLACLFDSLLELTISLGQLRFRIKDHSTFEVCQQELQALSYNLEECLLKLILFLKHKNTSSFNLEKWTHSVESFEIVNRNALQVVIKDPYILPIFIKNLEDLGKTLLMINQNTETL